MHRLDGERSSRTGGLDAAVISMIAAALLSGSCFFDTRTNLCEASGRRCASGQTCAVDQDACIPIGGCGDGVIDPARGEVCDDGNIRNGDGCSSDCSTDKLCGNGVIDPGEECDAGPADSPGCDRDCTFVGCGDDHVNAAAGEDCDTGSGNPDTATCNGMTCKGSNCGDGVYNADAGEGCDTRSDTPACNGDGSADSNNDIAAACQAPRCGDGYKNASFTPPGAHARPEACDASENKPGCNGNDNVDGRGNCQIPECGDGYKNPLFTPPGGKGMPEACDMMGNTSRCNGNDNTDGLGNCQVPRCGDGYKNASFKPTGSTLTEACDTGGDSQACNGDGNGNATNDSSAKCQPPACGDGYWNPMFRPPSSSVNEECDNGAQNSDSAANACRTNCRKAYCGDGVADAGEACGDKPVSCPNGYVCMGCNCVMKTIAIESEGR